MKRDPSEDHTHGAVTRRDFLKRAAAAAGLAVVPPHFQSWALGNVQVANADELEEGFASPPEATKPWVYWYWINDNVSREGITRDLEAMAQVGIGEALIGNIFRDDPVPGQTDQVVGDVKLLSEEWWGMVEHAVREGARLGVNIGFFNSPGWSQSGGPWVEPEETMRHMVTSETRMSGPQRFEGRLPVPPEAREARAEIVSLEQDVPKEEAADEGAASQEVPFRDVAVLAFPAPARDDDSIAAREPRVRTAPQSEEAERMVDGDLETAFMFPEGTAAEKPFTVDLTVDEAFTARSLVLHPAEVPFSVEVELQAAGETGHFRTVRTFTLNRSNPRIPVGTFPYGPVAVTFPAVEAKQYRLLFTGLDGDEGGGIAEIELTGAARLERYIEKQLGKMNQAPLDEWDAYLWPEPTEFDAEELSVEPAAVRDISEHLGPDGTLRWDVPEGKWIVLRTGTTPTGVTNAPASPEGTGLEVSKLDREAVEKHFDAYVGKLLERLSDEEQEVLRHVVADSYETGSENWTEGFAEIFREHYDYDPTPWLPVLTGRVVGSAEQSERFLWDVRRLVADLIAYNYVGGLREEAHEHGLRLWLENYGHWGFPAEFLQYGGQADHVSGEFWATGDLGSIELRAAASCSHIYGKPITSAEAFTGGPAWRGHPYALKKRGDWAYTEGINHFVLHVYIHQPWEERRPGMSEWFGTEFNRHNTWFDKSRAWINYLRRCHFLLQQGHYVADVAYFIGEDVPKMTGTTEPPLPDGYSFDYINAEVILNRLEVEEGRFTLPGGPSYRLLVLPPLKTMRPELLHKIRELVAAGGAILGPPPERSPSLENFPTADEEVRALAAKIWAGCNEGDVAHARFEGGHVFCEVDLETALDVLDTPPDLVAPEEVLWTHRATADADLYFLSNQQDRAISIAPVFRVSDRAPELWYPGSGRIVKTARYRATPQGFQVPLNLAPRGSVFVVFREASTEAPAVTHVMRNGRQIESGEASARNAMIHLPEVTRVPEGELAAEVGAAGDYRLQLASGTERSFEVEDLPPTMEIKGPWEVRFPENMDVPERTTFDTLASWTEHEDPAIEHFSGTATYTTTFDLPAPRVGEDRGLYLDLGEVYVIAEVLLNGKSLGVLWKPPFIAEVSNAAKAGSNTLEVRVTNTWLNRMVGDLKYPDDFPEPSGQPTQEKGFETWASVPRVSAEDELEPSGLIGPVRLRSTARVSELSAL